MRTEKVGGRSLSFYALGELVPIMRKHVDKEVRSYQSDFQIDVERLVSDSDEGASYEYVWITRKCGTWLIRVGGDSMTEEDVSQSLEFLGAVRETWPERHEYTITLNGETREFTFKRAARK